MNTSDPTKQPYDSNDVFNSNGALFAYVCSFSVSLGIVSIISKLIFKFNYMFLVVFTFPRMAIILRREYYSGLYQLWTAIMADMLALVPFTILMPLAYTAITYYMVGLNPAAGSFFLQWLTLFQIGTNLKCAFFSIIIFSFLRDWLWLLDFRVESVSRSGKRYRFADDAPDADFRRILFTV